MNILKRKKKTMKKSFIIISILTLIILATIYFLVTFQNIESPNNLSNFENKTLYNYYYFEPSNENFYYGNEMNFKNNIYYKTINTYEEYQKYKNLYPTIIDMNKTDFEEYFILLTITENESTKNLKLDSINSDINTLYVGLDKVTPEEEPNLNRGISIKISNNLLRDNIEVFKTIKTTDFMNNYKNIKQLPYEYSINSALSDNCFVISTSPANNIHIFNDFLENIQMNKDSEIRIITEDTVRKNMIIYDIKYLNSLKKYYVCIDMSRVIQSDYNSNSSISYTYNYYEFDSFKKVENSNILLKNAIIYTLSNSTFPENNLSFCYSN